MDETILLNYLQGECNDEEAENENMLFCFISMTSIFCYGLHAPVAIS